MKVILDKGAYMPVRAHDVDAGMDIRSPRTIMIPSGSSRVIDTGVHIEIPKGYAGFLKSKSGLNVKYSITSEGVIDAGYQGSICVKLYNHGSTWYEVQKGDKISQLVIMPILTPELEVVDKLDETDRGNGGFGSTGR
jgi:dUTP pyrophosphatase